MAEIVDNSEKYNSRTENKKNGIKDLNKKRKLEPIDFIEDPRVIAAVELVKPKNKTKEGGPIIVSDVLGKIDKETGHEYQYVNLVQKGGGVLGVALVGYVHVLEQAGIRFLKLAGTSAGAINTSLMVCAGTKEEPKTNILLKALIELKLSKLVDGHWVARKLIQGFVKDPDYVGRLKKGVFYLLGGLCLLLLLGFVGLGLQNKYNIQFDDHFKIIPVATCTIFVFTGIYLLSLFALLVYIISLFYRLKDSGFGINPGDYFYDFIKAQMDANKVTNSSELRDKAQSGIRELNLHLRDGRKEKMPIITGDVAFITSELVTQNKFEFPRMDKLFRTPEKICEIHPAGFVRASMSIPIFFESYFIREIPIHNKEIRANWKKEFNIDCPPEVVRFADGGMLSNFPINLFYEEDVEIPFLPIFGIDLDDSSPQDSNNNAEFWSLGGYLGRMFNTIRYYYDKDFLQKNKVAQKGIGKIHVPDFNWLNFFLTNQEQVDLFARGAEAAAQFLLNFDWEDYKRKQSEYYTNKNK